MNQSHRGSSRRHPKGAPPPAAHTLIELSIKRAGGSQPQTQIPYTADKLHRYSIISILIGLNETTNRKQKKPSRRNGRLAGHEVSISAQACLPADRPSSVHRKYSGRDRSSSLCLFMDCMVCWFHPPPRRRIAIGLDRRGVAPARCRP